MPGKTDPDTRAQAVRSVLERSSQGEPRASVITDVAHQKHIPEQSLRRWVREAQDDRDALQRLNQTEGIHFTWNGNAEVVYFTAPLRK